MWTRYQISRHARERWRQRFALQYKESLVFAVGNARFVAMLHARGRAWYVFLYRDIAFLFSRPNEGPEASLDTVWPLSWVQRKLDV